MIFYLKRLINQYLDPFIVTLKQLLPNLPKIDIILEDEDLKNIQEDKNSKS